MKKITKKAVLGAFIEKLGRKYSDELGISLSSGKDAEIFKWFLASLLFGAPIGESAVVKTYRCFMKHEILTPKRIVHAGWDVLVRILDEGSYTRYDFKTADKLLLVMQNLNDTYHGSLNEIHDEASGARDLEKKLKELGNGVGDVTISIFLRELRGLWRKADPFPTPLVLEAAAYLGIVDKNLSSENSLNSLKCFWKRNAVKGKSFVNFETALLRLGKDYIRRGRSFTLAC